MFDLLIIFCNLYRHEIMQMQKTIEWFRWSYLKQTSITDRRDKQKNLKKSNKHWTLDRGMPLEHTNLHCMFSRDVNTLEKRKTQKLHWTVLDSVKQEDFYVQVRVSTSFSEQQDTYNREMHPTSDSQKFHGMTMKIGLCTYLAFLTSYIIHVLVEKTPCWHWLYVVHFAYSKPPMVLLFILFYLNKITLQST